jgi:hypothetical protein
MSPLLLRIPAYSCLLLDFVGHSITNRCSPCGAVTRLHPVSSANSFPSCVESAVFHSSLSPLYLRVWESRETVLYIYSQQERSCSVVLGVVFNADRGLTGFHGSTDFFCAGCCVSVSTGSGANSSVTGSASAVVVGDANVTYFLAASTFSAAAFAWAGVASATCLVKISSAVSTSAFSSGSSGISAISSSSESTMHDDEARVDLTTCFCATLLTCNYFKKREILDGPSMSSTFLSLFLVLSK